MTDALADRSPRVAILLIAAVGLSLVAMVVLGATVGAAEPSPLPLELLEGGDPRSDGAGPGIVGSPLLILGAVVVLGLITAGVTVLLARLLQRD